VNIAMKPVSHILPDRFAWHHTDAGHDLCVDGTTIAEVRPLRDGIVLRILVDMGDIAPFEMAVRCEERAIGWATQWARQRANLLYRHADRQRALQADAKLALAG